MLLHSEQSECVRGLLAAPTSLLIPVAALVFASWCGLLRPKAAERHSAAASSPIWLSSDEPAPIDASAAAATLPPPASTGGLTPNKWHL